MTKKKSVKPSPAKSLNNLLILCLILLIGGIGAGLYFAHGNLSTDAEAANLAIEKLQEENAPLENIDEVSTTNQQFIDIVQIVPRLSIPISDVQSTATNDINKYARLTGIRISSTTYGKNDTSTGSATAQQGGSISNQTNAESTIKIETNDAVSMQSILQFIKLIENNLPVMYVDDISLDGADDGKVKLSSMTIGVITQ